MNMKASDFKANCLQLMDRVNEFHEEIVITKYGRPIAMLIPLPSTTPKPVFGFMKGSVKIKGDITKPISVKWEADK